MKVNFKIILFSISIIGIGFTSCKRNSIPCPGNGTSSARDLSLFDTDGNLKSDKKKKKSKKDESGLVNKKQDDRLKARRKASLHDKPKNMKK